MAALADGVIVGSAVVRLAGEANGVEQVRSFVARLRREMTTGDSSSLQPG